MFEDIKLSEALLSLAAFVGVVLVTAIRYAMKKPPEAKSELAVTSIGVELGNRVQFDMLVTETKRVADGIHELVALFGDQKQNKIIHGQDEITDQLQSLMKKIDEQERRQRVP